MGGDGTAVVPAEPAAADVGAAEGPGGDDVDADGAGTVSAVGLGPGAAFSVSAPQAARINTASNAPRRAPRLTA